MRVVVAIFHIGLIASIAYLLAKRWNEAKSKLFWSTFIYHLITGACVGMIYLYYYKANDTWLFFEGAKQLSNLAHDDFGAYLQLIFSFDAGNDVVLIDTDFRSLIFVKMLSLLCIVTWNNYWICAAYFSLLSFGASWFLFRKVKLYFEESTVAASGAFLFFPSVVFWSSGIVKETLALASLYFLAGILLQFFYEKKIDKLVLILALFAGTILWALKYYWAGVFFIAALSAIIVQQVSSKSVLVKKRIVISYILSFVFMGVAVSFLHPNFYLHRFLEVLVANHNAFVKLSDDHNLIHYYQLNASVGSVALNSLWALVSGIFRPVIGEGRSAFGLVASLENLIVLVLFISFLWRLGEKKQPVTILGLAAISYCVVLCVFLALSTPNLGTLSRYRVGFLPFLIFMISYRNPLVDWLTKKFSN